MDRLDAMSVFAAIVDGGSLSAAGRRLEVPLATVSRKLADLEAHVGTRLLTRTTRSLLLTDAGRAYLAACRQILEQVEEAERVAQGAYADVKGQLVVAAPIVFGRLHAVPVVGEFLELHPAITIDLRLGDRNVNLIEEQVDVALRIGPLPDSGLVATQLGAVRRVLCASPDYLRRAGTPASLDELAGHCCIAFSGLDGPASWRFATDAGGPRQVPVQARLIVTTADAAIAAATRGIGIARLLSYQVADALRDGTLVQVLAGTEPPAVPVSLVYPGQGRLPMKTRAFVDFATSRIRQRLLARGPGASASTRPTRARPRQRSRPRRGK